MKAVLYDHYGPADILELRELPDPPAQPGRARVRVHACAMNPKDVLIRKGKMRWLSPGGFPRCPGYDIAGELLDDAGDIKVGEHVYGMIQDNQGRGCAEVVSIPHDQIARKPERLSFVEAAAVPLAALTALQAFRDRMRLRAGDAVLLNGASGGVGTFAVQIAQAMGLEATAVSSSKNVELVTNLGAPRAIAYDEEDIFALRHLQAIFDIYGNLDWPRARRMLAPRGKYCTTVPTPGSVVRGLLGRVGLHRAQLVVVQSRREDLDLLTSWIDRDELSPIVDEVYAMADAAKAHRHLETKRTRGKVVIDLMR